MSNKVIIVSNRLPVSIKKRNNKYDFEHTVGGLASGLDSFQRSSNSVWVGWPGTFYYKEDKRREQYIEDQLGKKFNYSPVFQSQTDAEKFYAGYCNSTIWPLFHYFTQFTIHDKSFWNSYKSVNKKFCEAVLKNFRQGDSIWIHDYHLLLLPKLLRERLPKAKIGFFLHIPFPSYEVFRLLPQRKEILEGLLGSDIIGFQTYGYMRHFLDNVDRLLGLDDSLGQINTEDRAVRADVFPIGIDYERYNKASEDPKIEKEITRLKKKIGNRKVILSVDRLDYTKGIPQRLKAFTDFLERFPRWREKVIFILVASPSRTKVESYRLLKKQIDELIGRINGKYGGLGWSPILYLYRSLDFPELSALYTVADIALVTPIRDGMNLVAKEFISTKTDGSGVLILSEMAGAVEELRDALVVNPTNNDEMIDALKKALEMSRGEQTIRNRAMQKSLAHYNERLWAESFIKALSESGKLQKEEKQKTLTPTIERTLLNDYKKSKKRLLLLDYDGTLVPFAPTPEEARPDDYLLSLIKNLSNDSKNEVVIISGRDKDFLGKWFGEANVDLVAEHGAWIKEKGRSWTSAGKHKTEWKKKLRPVLDKYVERTPGSFVEEKDLSLIWHYRKADPVSGKYRSKELIGVLEDLIMNLTLQIQEGNKIIEVRNADVNKGKAVSRWLLKRKWDFIMALGDDRTDEDTFKTLPKKAYSIKVGSGQTQARFKIKSVRGLRLLLKELV